MVPLDVLIMMDSVFGDNSVDGFKRLYSDELRSLCLTEAAAAATPKSLTHLIPLSHFVRGLFELKAHSKSLGSISGARQITGLGFTFLQASLEADYQPATLEALQSRTVQQADT